MGDLRCTPINVGGKSYVIAERVVAVLATDTAPIRRTIREAKDKGTLLDASQHRELKTLILMDNGHLVASYLTPETVARKLMQKSQVEEGAISEPSTN